MALWHFSPKTQRAERCSAEDGNCPYGGEHVEGDMKVARAFEEKVVKEKYEIFTPVSKKRRSNSEPIVISNKPSKTSSYVWSDKNKLIGYRSISPALKQYRISFNKMQSKAIEDYSGSEYKNINDYLRGVRIDVNDVPKTIRNIRHIESAFKKVPSLTEDIVVKRTQVGVFGFNFDEIYERQNNGGLNDDDKPKIRIKGYFSTSANSSDDEKGYNFISPNNPDYVSMSIIVPKGFKALDVSAINTMFMSDEQEILIKNDSVLIIDGVGYDAKNNKKVFAHLEPAYKSTDDDRKFYQNVDLDALNEEFNKNNKLR